MSARSISAPTRPGSYVGYPTQHGLGVNRAAIAAADAVASRASTSNDQMTSQTWSDEDSDVEGALVAHSTKSGKRIGPDEICAACGGLGHHSKIGNQKCLTVVLGNMIPKEDLHEIKYPRGLKYPNFHRGAKEKFMEKDRDEKQKHQEAKIAEAEATLREAGKLPMPRHKGKSWVSHTSLPLLSVTKVRSL